MRFAVNDELLVPYGTASPPPSPFAALLAVSVLLVIVSVEASPTMSIPPPSPELAALPEIVLLKTVRAQRTQAIPPPAAAVLPETVLLFNVRWASVAPSTGLNAPKTAMPPPSLPDPAVAPAALAVTVQLFSVTEACWMLIPPPGERNPVVDPPRIVRLLNVTAMLPWTLNTPLNPPPSTVELFPVIVSPSVMVNGAAMVNL